MITAGYSILNVMYIATVYVVCATDYPHAKARLLSLYSYY